MNMLFNSLTTVFLFLMLSSLNKSTMTINKIFIVNYSNNMMLIMSAATMIMISSSFKMSNMNNKMKSNESMIYSFIGFMSMMVFSCNEMMSFFVLFEITVIPMIIVMVYFSKEKEKITALFYMITTNMMFSLPFVMYILFFKTSNKTSNMEMSKIMSMQNLNMIMFMSMSLMLLTKYPMFFFHSWLPKAHVEASTSGSMVLASILLKLGTMGMEKNMSLMEKVTKKSLTLMKMAAINGLIISSIIAIRSMDLKKMMAVSSISHMAMVLYNTISLKQNSMEFSKMMMFSHGLISPLMFLMVGKVYENKKTRSIFSSKNMESMNKSYSMMWFIIMMMNVGLPPMMNVASEILMVFSMYSENKINILPLCIFLMLSSSISMIFIIKMNNFKTKKMYSTKKNETTNMNMNVLLSSSLLLNLNLML